MVTYVFPGQGSQKKGMGKSLFSEFTEEINKVNKILGYSMIELCLENPNNQLNQTQYTQPALYVVNALTYLKKFQQEKRIPDYVAGHSLGEYSALFASGAIDFETGLRLVQKRGGLMDQAKDGAMVAIIGLSEGKIKESLSGNNLESIDIANYNTPSQTVIAGLKNDIEKAKTVFEENGARMVIPLKVSGAFHSRYMKDGMKKFEEYLKRIEFSELKIPVISNVHARPYMKENIANNLIKQMTHPVKWTDSIRYLMGRGKMEFQEIGPGDVLTRLIKKIQEETTSPVMSKDEKEKYINSTKLQSKNITVKKIKTTVSKEKDNKIHVKRRSLLIDPESLGSEEYKRDYNVKFAYAAGGMYRGISSKELVIGMGKGGMIGYFGTGGLNLQQIEDAIAYIQKELKDGQAYGANLLHNPESQQIEEETVNLFLKYNVRNIEASAYMQMTPALVRYRAKGLSQKANGITFIANKIMAKVSRPEVAQAFLNPAPERIVNKLVENNTITKEEADLLKKIPMADDLCVEADSGGHSDRGVAYTLMPAMIKLRDDIMRKFNYQIKVRIGAAGGIGTPEAAASAFILGADFILTGSINQCSVEAGTSDAVKDLLESMNVQDTDYAPAGDMFEIGAKVQVLKKGLFFPARANKLYDLYRHYDSLDEIDEKTKKQIQEKYFHRSFDEVYDEVKNYFSGFDPHQIEKAERNPKHKMALIFRWYFGYSTDIAITGNKERKVDFQIQCGPALGAFNQWVKGTELEHWKKRHVEQIAEKIIVDTAELLSQRINFLVSKSS